jgi:hypothetical protein
MMFVCRLIGLNFQKELCEKVFHIKEQFNLSIKKSREKVDFCHHRCKHSINIIGQSVERKSSKRASQVCMSNEAKEIFFFLCLSHSPIFHPFLLFDIKKTQSAQIIALLRSSLVFCSYYFFFHSEIESILLLLFLFLYFLTESKKREEHKMEFIT